MSLPAFFQQEVIEKSHEKPVVVDFWAPWCGPCHILGPVLEKLARESKGTWRLVKVNTDQHPELAMYYHVRGIPTVKLFHKGKVVDEFVGPQPESVVRQWLRRHVPEWTEA